MKAISAFISFLLICNLALAQNWTGAVSSDWNNNANWSDAPSNGASISIDPINYTGGAFSPIILVNSTFTISTMIVSNGAVLTIQGNLTTTDDVDVLDANSEIILNNGIFNVNFADNGRLTADLGGKITVNGGTLNVGARLISGNNAQITVNNGAVTTNERLLIDLGGKIIVNNGTVSVGLVMALADGDLANSSYYEQNGGSVTVTGSVSLENEAGNFQPTILINGGVFTLNGDLAWFGVTPGSGTPRFITTGGTTNINGLISNLPLSTVNMMLDIKNTSAFNFNGASIDLIHSTDSIKQSGNSIFKLSGTHNFNNVGVVYSTDGLVLCNGTTNLLGSGTYIFHDVTVASTKTLNHTMPFEIFINGDFSKMGTFNPSSNKVTFNGSTPQTISGNLTFNFGSIEINTISGVTLNHPISVAGALTLTNGNLNTTAINILTMNANSTSTAGSLVSFVNGPLKKVGNTPFVFPIGKNGLWRRLSISAPSLVTSEMTAEYFNTQAINTTVFNSPLNAVSSIEYWQLEKSNPADNSTVELFWEDALLSGIFDCASTTIAHYNGTEWDNVISTTTGGCTSSNSGTVLSNTPQSNLGLYTFGYFGNVVSQTITVCNGGSLAVGSNTYTQSGIYIDLLTDMNSNDSTVITHLTVLTPLSSTQNVQLCFGESYTIGSSIYTTSGSYLDTLITGIGCDSTVLTNLSVLPAISATQNIQICFGESYTVGSSAYTTPGSYLDTLVSVTGCDSTVTTNLTVTSPINTTVTLSGILISCNNTAATGYQWLDCGNGNALILGATSSTFLPTQNGNYAVEVTEGLCKDTSICTLINSVGVMEQSELVDVLVYPNPSNGLFIIQLPNDITSFELEVIDFKGETLIKKGVNSTNFTECNLTTFPNGFYMVRLFTENASLTLKLIKE